MTWVDQTVLPPAKALLQLQSMLQGCSPGRVPAPQEWLWVDGPSGLKAAAGPRKDNVPGLSQEPCQLLTRCWFQLQRRWQWKAISWARLPRILQKLSSHQIPDCPAFSGNC